MIRGSMTRCVLLAAALLAGLAARGRAEETPTAPREAAPAATASPAPPSLPARRYRIESIAVTGARRATASRVVIAESRVVTGREYGEADLRDAVRRIKRLPFVLEARPTLRRGTAPGLYELVLEIEEASSFVGTGSVSLASDGAVGGEAALSADRFVGSSSRVSASFGLAGLSSVTYRALSGVTQELTVHPPTVKEASLGFQQYDILGSGSRLSLEIGSTFGGPTGTAHSSVSLLLPTARNHSIVLKAGLWRFKGGQEYDATLPRFDPAFLRFNADSVRVKSVTSARWIYNTTDDPFAPLEGTFITGGLGISHTLRDDADRTYPWRADRTTLDSDLSVLRAFRLGRRLTLEAHLGGTCASSEDDHCRDSGLGAALRYVHVGRRNRSRAFAEIDATLGGWGHSTLGGTYYSGAWRATVGLRLPFAAVSFSFIRRFND
jgi:hypothetical protein